MGGTYTGFSGAAQSAAVSAQSETMMTALEVQFEGCARDTLDLMIACPKADRSSPE